MLSETPEPKTHRIKIHPRYFVQQLEGRKNYELRRNDRGYARGDILILCEWEPRTTTFTGKELPRRITAVVEGIEGLEPGYCLLHTERCL